MAGYPGAARVGIDKVGGVVLSGSPNTFVNGAASVRVGDPVSDHGSYPHDNAVIVEGAPTVFINGKPASRQYDLASCGHELLPGSSNVFIGKFKEDALLSTEDSNPMTSESSDELLREPS